ncbi:RNA polymerase sigma-70 factor [Mangrovimonas yunxiaonensis]|uniref:RNA polymerase sigma-70 factor n=1 Tax=Mangrovimonas yunxiaonensis TaxID=1197477 RepID=A0A084TMP3_9FLAO|nr:sigma-70 family RNA polymerase sigma factor [Mangrovimonas yunxiaonensis]KFB01979.1 RNA polymerase sigma-70 factor [Mangrovimonas yunxiaonensis]GGH45116.1 RNA polymerase sigma-70 factor [Mangrovimonas yunxiaonensis]
MKKDLPQNVCEEPVFERVYNACSKDLYDFLYYKYGEDLTPEDKVQEAFVTLWENCNKVAFGKARAFLFTVANNLMRNAIKHKKVVLNYQKATPKVHTQETPQFLLEKDEYLKRYQQVLQQLSEEQRVAFLLSKVEGKKHKEIANMLGVTQKVVEYRIYSAFKIFKAALEHFKA